MAFRRMPEANPDLPTPVGPISTMFSFFAMKSSSARARICLRLTPGWRWKGNVSRDPALGQFGVADAPLQRVFLTRVPLGAHQSREELAIGDVVFIGGAQLFVIDVGDAAEFEILEQLLEFFIHRHWEDPFPIH
jgi:hypothetical protein